MQKLSKRLCFGFGLKGIMETDEASVVVDFYVLLNLEISCSNLEKLIGYHLARPKSLKMRDIGTTSVSKVFIVF